MAIDWPKVVADLTSRAPGAHRFRPRCSDHRIESVQEQLGSLPTEVAAMLKCFNGARLFNRCGELVALFGLSEAPPPPALEWSSDWWIDKFTPSWRESGDGRQHDWAVAMTNYGDLLVVSQNGTARQWKTSDQRWGGPPQALEDWLNAIVHAGEIYLEES